MKKTETFVQEFGFVCPFCGKKGSVCKAAGSEQHAVMHELPTCAEYDSTDDPAAYLAKVRGAWESAKGAS